MKIIYDNADMLFYCIFIFLTIVLLVLKISKYKRDHKVVKVIKYILAIPITILNMLIFGDLNISLQLFKDENKTDNKKWVYMTDLQKKIWRIKKQNFHESERIKFIADFGSSEKIAYHYKLICKDRDEGTNLNLYGNFYKHDKEGLEYLFTVLDNEKEECLKVFDAYLMAETL